MTTTVTLKTHDWPCSVESTNVHEYSDTARRSWGHSVSTEFVPANTERTFSVTDTCSVTFRELPKDATGLSQPEAPAAA